MQSTPFLLVADVMWQWAVAIVLIFILFIFVIIIGQFFGLWLQAFMSGAGVSFEDLIGMRLRKVDARVVVLSKIRAVKAGLNITTRDLETHYLAGGDLPGVVNALIAADRAKIDLSWQTACEIDLEGRDVLEAVQTSVDSKAIDSPSEE